MKLSTPQKKSVQIAEAIKKLILSGAYQSGQKLDSMRALANRFSVSTQAVISAFEILEKENLIERKPQKGIYVSDISSRNCKIKVVFDLRILPERAWLKIIRGFESGHSGIKVVPFFISSSSDYARNIELFAPDVFGVRDSVWRYFYERKMLADIAPFVESEQLEDKIFHSLFDLFREKKRLYCAPFRFTTLALFYNKDIFLKGNSAYPDSLWRWKELFGAAKNLVRRNDSGFYEHYGFELSANVTSMFSFIRQNGVEPFSKQMASNFSCPEAKEALGFWYERMVREGVSAAFANDGINSIFMSGKSAMAVGKYDLTRKLSGGAGFNWGVEVLPKQKKRASTLSIYSFGILRKTESFEASSLFLKYLLSEKAQKISADEGWGLPSNRFVAGMLSNSKPFIDTLKYAKPTWDFASFEPIKAVREEMLQLTANLQSAERCCDMINEKCRILSGDMSEEEKAVYLEACGI